MLKIITNCPSCGSLLERVNSQIFCRNKDCDAQFAKKLAHFVKVMKIKGLGEKTLDKLEINDISDLYELELDYFIAKLGEKIGTKIYDEVENSTRADLATVLQSFSIPLVGETASKKLCEVVSHVDEITAESCSKAGLGEKATNNLLTFLAEETELLSKLPFTFQSTAKRAISAPKGLTVVITGKLNKFSSRDLCKQYLEELGVTVSDNVTKATNYLIDDEGKQSTKRSKAESYNIQVVSFEEFLIKENLKK